MFDSSQRLFLICIWIFFSLSAEDVTWAVEFCGAISGCWCTLVYRSDFCTLRALSLLYLGPQFRSNSCTLHALIIPPLVFPEAFSGGPCIHSPIFFTSLKMASLIILTHLSFFFFFPFEAKSALNTLRHLGVIQGLDFIQVLLGNPRNRQVLKKPEERI